LKVVESTRYDKKVFLQKNLEMKLNLKMKNKKAVMIIILFLLIVMLKQSNILRNQNQMKNNILKEEYKNSSMISEKKSLPVVHENFKWIFNNNIFQYSVYLIEDTTEKRIESKIYY
jgi:hypothetical protein